VKRKKDEVAAFEGLGGGGLDGKQKEKKKEQVRQRQGEAAHLFAQIDQRSFSNRDKTPCIISSSGRLNAYSPSSSEEEIHFKRLRRNCERSPAPPRSARGIPEEKMRKKSFSRECGLGKRVRGRVLLRAKEWRGRGAGESKRYRKVKDRGRRRVSASAETSCFPSPFSTLVAPTAAGCEQ
jgi:hypothetical protein